MGVGTKGSDNTTSLHNPKFDSISVHLDARNIPSGEKARDLIELLCPERIAS